MLRIGIAYLARKRAGFREKYAMDHGRRQVIKEKGRVLWVFEYSQDDPFQDGNGATYSVTEGRWVN